MNLKNGSLLGSANNKNGKNLSNGLITQKIFIIFFFIFLEGVLNTLSRKDNYAGFESNNLLVRSQNNLNKMCGGFTSNYVK